MLVFIDWRLVTGLYNRLMMIKPTKLLGWTLRNSHGCFNRWLPNNRRIMLSQIVIFSVRLYFILLGSQESMDCVGIDRRILTLRLYLFQILNSVVHLFLLAYVNRWQEILHDIVLPVIDLPIPNLLLLFQFWVLNAKSSFTLEFSKSDLIKLLREWSLWFYVRNVSVGYVRLLVKS